MGKNNTRSLGRHKKKLVPDVALLKATTSLVLPERTFYVYKVNVFQGSIFLGTVGTQYFLDRENDCDNVSIAQVLLLFENMYIG